MTRYDRRSIALSIALSTLAGYVDAFGFLSTGNFFISFMSGNSTRMGVALGERRYVYAVTAAGVIALFVGGVMIGTLVGRRAGRHRRPVVLLLVAALLAAAAIFRDLNQSRLMTAALLLAMGSENAVLQQDGEVSIGLTYMTGTLVKIGQRLAAIFHGGPVWAWVPYSLLWIGLVTGATIGAIFHLNLPEIGLWLAASVGLLLAWLSTKAPLPTA